MLQREGDNHSLEAFPLLPWNEQPIEAEEKLPESDCLLPSGASPLWPYYVFTITRPPPAYGVLSCLRVLNLADSSW